MKVAFARRMRLLERQAVAAAEDRLRCENPGEWTRVFVAADRAHGECYARVCARVAAHTPGYTAGGGPGPDADKCFLSLTRQLLPPLMFPAAPASARVGDLGAAAELTRRFFGQLREYQRGTGRLFPQINPVIRGLADGDGAALIGLLADPTAWGEHAG